MVFSYISGDKIGFQYLFPILIKKQMLGSQIDFRIRIPIIGSAVRSALRCIHRFPGLAFSCFQNLDKLVGFFFFIDFPAVRAAYLYRRAVAGLEIPAGTGSIVSGSQIRYILGNHLFFPVKGSIFSCLYPLMGNLPIQYLLIFSELVHNCSLNHAVFLCAALLKQDIVRQNLRSQIASGRI